jgi:Family of unknown function (DUF6247)
MVSQIMCAFTSTLEHSRNTWDLDLVGTVLKAWHSRLQGKRREERDREGRRVAGVGLDNVRRGEEEEGILRYSDRRTTVHTTHKVLSPPSLPK